MNPFQIYFDSISKKLAAAFSQAEKIKIVANWVAESISSDGWIYTFGTGHSHLLAEEIFYRAGGFARVIPILDSKLMLHENASESTKIERIEGYASKLLKQYNLNSKDTFIISSNSGRNPVAIEMAQIAKAAGTKVICITNLKHSQSVDSRHSSGLKLYEIADQFLDNFGEIGDASISLKGLSTKVGATSTVIGSAIIQAIMVEATSILLEKGIQPEIFSSSNSDEDECLNGQIIKKYKYLVKAL